MSWVLKNPFRDMPGLGTHDGRRAWAFLAIVGGSMAFTLIVVWTLWALRNHPNYLFYLALAAHAQVFVGMGAIGWAMGRRSQQKVTKDGVEIDDREA